MSAHNPAFLESAHYRYGCEFQGWLIFVKITGPYPVTLMKVFKTQTLFVYKKLHGHPWGGFWLFLTSLAILHESDHTQEWGIFSVNKYVTFWRRTLFSLKKMCCWKKTNCWPTGGFWLFLMWQGLPKTVKIDPSGDHAPSYRQRGSIFLYLPDMPYCSNWVNQLGSSIFKNKVGYINMLVLCVQTMVCRDGYAYSQRPGTGDRQFRIHDGQEYGDSEAGCKNCGGNTQS